MEQGELLNCLNVVDRCGVLLADHGHTWHDQDREAYDDAILALRVELKMNGTIPACELGG